VAYRQGWRPVYSLAGRQLAVVRAWGMRLPGRRIWCALFSRRCRTKHLPLLGFEEPSRVLGKLLQLDPLSCIGATAMRNALLVMAVHGVNPCLKPLMLGAQANESCLLQAPGIEIHGYLAFRCRRPWAQSRFEVRRLPLCASAGLKANASTESGKARQAQRGRGEQPVSETRDPWSKPWEAARPCRDECERYGMGALPEQRQSEPKCCGEHQSKPQGLRAGRGACAAKEPSQRAAIGVRCSTNRSAASEDHIVGSAESWDHAATQPGAEARQEQQGRFREALVILDPLTPLHAALLPL